MLNDLSCKYSMYCNELFEADSDQRELVFVYGSLKRSFGNDWHLEHAQFIGTGLTPPRFDMLDLGSYPAVIRGKNRILGEIYEVDQATMKALDKLEANGFLYQRKKVPIVMRGRQLSAWLYIYLLHDGSEWTPIVEPYTSNIVTWRNRG